MPPEGDRPQPVQGPQQVDAPNFLPTIVEQMRLETSTRSYLSTDTATSFLPPVELANPTGAMHQIVRSGDNITAVQHGGAQYNVRQEGQPPQLQMQLGQSWVPININERGDVSFQRSGLNITLMSDGSTQSLSPQGLRTIRYADGSRAYFQRNPATPGSSTNTETLVAMRHQDGRAYRVAGASQPNSDGICTVQSITGGPHNLNLTAGGETNRQIRVTPRTGEIVVSETRNGQAVETRYQRDGRKIESTGGNTTTTWPGNEGFRLQTGPAGTTLTDASGRNWNITRNSDGISEITGPGGQPRLTSANGPIDFDNRGNIVQRRTDNTSQVVRGDGSVQTRDAQGRTTQVRMGDRVVDIVRNPSNPDQITSVRQGSNVLMNSGEGPITVDERGNINQRVGHNTTNLRPDGTRLVANSQDGTERTFNLQNQLVSLKDRGGNVLNLTYANGQISEVRTNGQPPRVVARVGENNVASIRVLDNGQIGTFNAEGRQLGTVTAGGGRVTLDANNRPTEVRRGRNGEQRWTIGWNNSTNPPTIRSLTREGQPPITDIRNANVDAATGQITYEQNGRRFTLNPDGSSREERDFGQPHVHSVTRNADGFVTQQDFMRANGQRGQRTFHYQTNPDGTVVRNAQGQPIISRIDFQQPGPCSLVRTQDGRYELQTDDPNVRRMMQNHQISGAWNANPQIDAEGNLTMQWRDGRTLRRPVDARQDRDDRPGTPVQSPTDQPSPPQPGQQSPGQSPQPGSGDQPGRPERPLRQRFGRFPFMFARRGR